MLKKKFHKICRYCGNEYLSAVVRSCTCDKCREVVEIKCSCGCNKIIKREVYLINQGSTYYHNHQKKGKTYEEIYNKPRCEIRNGFKCGKLNESQKPEIRKKLSESIKKSYTPELRKRRLESLINRCLPIYSKISQELFFKVYFQLSSKNHIHFGELNGEFNYWCEERRRLYSYDFVDTEKKKVIEFNGDIWHANPEFYRENSTPNPKDKNLTAKEIWEFDRLKLDFLRQKGFDILVVWHSEYEKKKEETVNRCINFLSN